jgi:solute carrier family 35 protein E1
MYTSTMDGVSPTSSTGLSKFPAFIPDGATGRYADDHTFHYPSSSPSRASVEGERWQPRRMSRTSRPHGGAYHAAPARHGRQKSLSEAIRTIRTRSGSMSQNAHEIADALKAPVSPRLVVGCDVQKRILYPG